MGETLAIGATATPSLLKLEVSAVRQRLSELAVDMVGSDGVRWWPHGLPDARAAIVPRYLADRAHSIFGGALEIQKGIIAKTLLDSIS